jgi:hypothetical protein
LKWLERRSQCPLCKRKVQHQQLLADRFKACIISAIGGYPS